MSTHSTAAQDPQVVTKARSILEARREAKPPSMLAWLPAAALGTTAGIGALILGVMALARCGQALLAAGADLTTLVQPELILSVGLLMGGSMGLALVARHSLRDAALARYQQQRFQALPTGQELLDRILAKEPELAPLVNTHCLRGHPLLMQDVHHLAVVTRVPVTTGTAR